MNIDETSQKLGAAVKRKRKRLKVSLRNVGVATGISRTTIHRVESGLRCNADTVTRLAGWLGVPVDRFFQSDDIENCQAVVYNPDEPLPDIIEAILLKDENLTGEKALSLAELFRTAYEQFADFTKK